MSSIFLPKLNGSAIDGLRSARRALEDQTPALMQNSCSQCGGGHDSKNHPVDHPIQGGIQTGPSADMWDARMSAP